MTVMMVRLLAKDLAGADFEKSRTERYRNFWKDVRNFQARTWPQYVEEARSILAGMLARPDVPEHQKNLIHAALVEDRRRSMQSKGVKPGIGQLKLRPDQPGSLEKFLFHDNKDAR